MTLTGDPGITELEAERTYDSRNGWRTVRRWKGTKDAVNAFIPTVVIDGSSIRIIPEQGSPLAVLEAWFDNAQDGSALTADSQIQTVWSVLGNDLEQDIFEHSKFSALADGVRTILKQYRDGSATYNEAYSLLSVASAPSDAYEFLDSLEQHEFSYTKAQVVLRRSKLVSGFATLSAINANANEVYTRAQLITAESIPAAVQAEMPATGIWLARTGQKEQQSNGKYQVTQEWWHGDVASFLYTAFTP